ncbi:DUF4270 domain-containing protein [Maribacter algarum]|uniref:DUF4270 domain-containing protein n=1 Tax=Maribacter algarum (ex Zhang et al. 2020) TaxID=2578118 RepID=A0A5S3QMZ4_9FLAO|nr:DUF4270 domain-containing protein [Maribacter algarum]TMM59274.1 DUF4270 domain-containing protein [Maribacter algarum]
MNLLNRFKLPAIAGILLVVGFMSSCEQELTSIGEGVIGGEPFITNKRVYNVFAFNKKIEAVQTNQLPVYQLGVFNDPVYGKTEASITSQVQLSVYNPTFGDLSASNELSNAFDEKERIDSIFIYIPYQNNQTDTDNDGVVDALDSDPDDATNDDDGDTVPNNEEAANNTDPLNPDTDGDGINDNVDDSTLGDRFAKRFRLDSIYGDRTRPFNFKVERSTFFLRDLDPNSNFQESQEYFSSQEFSPAFTQGTLVDTVITINDYEILNTVQEDDPDTEDVDEKGTITSRESPGIYVRLNRDGKEFFQQSILDKEGGTELLSASNFKEFLRGIHISVMPEMNQELMFLMDITDAKIIMYYSHDKDNDGVTEVVQKTLEMRLITQVGTNPIVGNAVNTFINADYPVDITSTMDSGEDTDRVYLKGGAGSYAEIKLFDEIDSEAEILINEIKANNWIINEANLVFNIDTDALPMNAIEPPRLYLYNAETNAPLYNVFTEDNAANTPLGVYLNYDGLLEEDGGRGIRYTVKITEYLNDIIVRDSTNATLGLAITADIRLEGANNVMLSGNIEKELPAASILSPLGTVLFGSDLPEGDANKLKLEISYTETN